MADGYGTSPGSTMAGGPASWRTPGERTAAMVGEEYKAHVESLLAPVKGEMTALRAELARLEAAGAAEGRSHGEPPGD